MGQRLQIERWSIALIGLIGAIMMLMALVSLLAEGF